MTTSDDLLNDLMSVDIHKISQESIEETKDAIIEKQKDQLRHGLDSTGKLIGSRKPYQSSDYAFYKANKNPLPGLGNPDLIDKGDFIRAIKVDVTADFFQPDSLDEKTASLKSKYGDEILDLNEESALAYAEETLEPVFNKNIQKALRL